MVETTSIALIIIGYMFWAIWLAFKIEIQDDEKRLLPMNGLFFLILLVSGCYTAYFSINIALGIAFEASMGEEILSGLRSIFTLNGGLIIIVLFLIVIKMIVDFWEMIILFVDKHILRKR